MSDGNRLLSCINVLRRADRADVNEHVRDVVWAELVTQLGRIATALEQLVKARPAVDADGRLCVSIVYSAHVPPTPPFVEGD